MNVTLLGHYDIASLYAMDRTMALLPDCTFTVLLSRDAATEQQASPMVELARADTKLCDALIAGKLQGCDPLRLPATARKPFNTPNSPDGLLQLSDSRPDIIISIRFRKILKEPAIAIPKHGVLNLHSGILPDYRGVMATFWAMLAGEQIIGSTLHRIVDSGIDTGPVISIQKQLMRPEKSYLANVLSLYNPGSDAIAAAVRTLVIGGALGEYQPDSDGRYFSFPTDDDIAKFHVGGYSLADGSEHCEVQNTV